MGRLRPSWLMDLVDLAVGLWCLMILVGLAKGLFPTLSRRTVEARAVVICLKLVKAQGCRYQNRGWLGCG